MEESGCLRAQLVSVPAREPDRDADTVHVWRPGFQRAAAELGADVPGRAEHGRRYPARHLSGPVSRFHASQLSEGPPGALDRLVRQVPEHVAAYDLHHAVAPGIGAGPPHDTGVLMTRSFS